MTKQRRSRDETRVLMLEAGLEVLLRDGISLGASTFRYSDAFELLQNEHGIKVTRGSVHERIWSSQEAWQLDVLASCITDNEETLRKTVSSAVIERIAELPLETEVDRLNVLAELCRVSSLVLLQTIEDNPSFRLFPITVAAWKASSNTIPEYHELGRMLCEAQNRAGSNFDRGLIHILELANLGVVPSRGLSFDDAVQTLRVNVTALTYGQTLRSRHDPALTEIIQACGPDGERREWNHLGLATWLIARGLFGPCDLGHATQPSTGVSA